MDQGVSRGEDLQGFSAVEIWEEGGEGYIVREAGRDRAHKCFGSINTRNSHLCNLIYQCRHLLPVGARPSQYQVKKSKNIKLSSGYAFGANDNGKNFQQLFEPQNFSKLENISLLRPFI